MLTVQCVRDGLMVIMTLNMDKTSKAKEFSLDHFNLSRVTRGMRIPQNAYSRVGCRVFKNKQSLKSWASLFIDPSIP